MRLINSFDDSPNQSQRFVLDDGTIIDFSIRFVANQRGWFYSFTYGAFTVNNRRLICSPNMIRQFQNILPFGFGCTTTDGQEPVFKDDFKTERAKFYLLDANDVQSVENLILA